MFLSAVLTEKLTAWEEMWNEIWPKLINLGLKLIAGIAILFFGRLIIKLLLGLVNKGFSKSKVEKGVVSFSLSVVKGLLYIILLIIIAQVLGVPTASLIALLGSAGLAIGLALQGSLSNFAGGVLIMVLKPFKVGDYIVTGSGEGTVTGIDIFYTRLRTPDNRVVVIPNGTLSNSAVTNVSKEKTRRVDLKIPVAYSSDINIVRDVLKDVIAEQGDKVLEDKGLDIYVSEFANSSIDIIYRFWVKSSDYWAVRFAVLERVKEKFETNGIEIPFNQLDVHMKNGK
ncbi:MAG: mechanosensitive ion channel [Lachnospiraceae bacterium]|nr:mechanosensitive ion channel [Lachnospiraceae bacterium]